MLHPNHKLQTRLQLIKRLLNTSNCEIILKCILSLSDSQQTPISFNLKLAFYLNTLINSNSISHTQVGNNDKEILNHLNSMLINAGFNYKNELSSSAFSALLNRASSFDLSDTTESSYLFVQSSSGKAYSSNPHAAKKNTLDLTTQFEKDHDEEVIKIYKKSHLIFKKFLEQFDRLTEDLNVFSTSMTNQVVAMHSQVRKLYLQRLKNKRIQAYDVKQKWTKLIENMTHERCFCYDSNTSLDFYILDQTEGPNRERRRLKKSHLFIPERFFKEEQRVKLLNEKQPTPLRYLLYNYEDYLAASSGDGFEPASKPSSFMGDYLLYHLKNSEVIM